MDNHKVVSNRPFAPSNKQKSWNRKKGPSEYDTSKRTS